MKLLKPSLIALSLVSSFAAFSESVAITNATIYTSNDQGVLTNASIVFEDGVITAVNPATVSADTVINAEGKVVTAGIISALNQVGLVEVSAVSTSRDGSAKKASVTFDPSYAFNAESTLIPFARKAGITRSVVSPYSWGETFHGQTFNVLMNSKLDSVETSKTAVVVTIGAASKDSRASSIIEIRNKLKDQKDKLAKASEESEEDKKSDKEPSAEEKAYTSLLNGEIPLVAWASRASDLLHLIDIKNEFGVKVVIAGGKDATKVKDELAKAEITVMVNVVDNLPGNFDSLGADLVTAGELEKAGVDVIVFNSDSHMIHNLRFDAGNAVSYGMSSEGAIKALTSNVAKAFNMNAGTLAKGHPADVVLWSGDPLEISSYAESVWINGEKVSTESRHDKLRDRYTSKEAKARSYIK